MYCGSCGGFYSPDCPHRAQVGSDPTRMCAPAENPFEIRAGLVAIDLLEKKISEMEIREQDLLLANNRYLQRARDAEAKLKEMKCPSSPL